MFRLSPPATFFLVSPGLFVLLFVILPQKPFFERTMSKFGNKS